MPRFAVLALAGLALLSSSVQAENPAYLKLTTARDEGRALWLENCEGCHGYGIAGAPIPMEAEEWRVRLQQPQSVLYQHAIEGFFGPDDTMMPPRGGNPELTDRQVKLAVDYMTALARHYVSIVGESQ